MNPTLNVRIEITPPGKTILPWVAISRRGRQSVESQFFALIGYTEREFSKFAPAVQEFARDRLENALRHISAFEYIPANEDEIDDFFEKKLLNFERTLKNSSTAEAPPFHAALGVARDNTVRFSVAGEITVLHITPSVITVLNDTNSGRCSHFDTYQTGTLFQHSCLLFVPKTAAALLKSDELKNIPFSTSLERKLQYLEQIWQNRATSGSPPFRAILLEAKPKNIKVASSTSASIANLLNTEAKTEELLSPPLFRPFLKSIESAAQKVRSLSRRVAETYQTRRKERLAPPKVTAEKLEKQPIPKRPQPQNADYSPTPQLTNLSSHLYKTSSSIGTPISKKIWERLASPFRFETLIARFNAFPTKSKLLLIFSATFLFIFTEGVLLTRQHGKIVKMEGAINEEITSIRNLINTANASLIYEDEEKAQIQMSEAGKRIEELPQFQKTIADNLNLRSLRRLKSVVTASIVDELRGELSPLQEQLQHIIAIDKPAEILVLAGLLEKPKGLLIKDGAIFAYNADALVKKQGEVIQKINLGLSSSGGSPVSLMIPHDTKNTLLVVSGTLAYTFNHAEEKLSDPILLQGEPVYAAIYNRRLYALNPNTNQIYRYDPSPDSFSLGESWIKDGALVDQGQTLSIDGFVYVLKTDGQITKFLRGQKQEFQLKPIDPAFSLCGFSAPASDEEPPADTAPQSCARRLSTNADSSYLYILDPPGNRLAVFSKNDGLLKAQYVCRAQTSSEENSAAQESSCFTDLKDFAIDEAGKTAYLLNGTTILSIPLSHL